MGSSVSQNGKDAGVDDAGVPVAVLQLKTMNDWLSISPAVGLLMVIT